MSQHDEYVEILKSAFVTIATKLTVTWAALVFPAPAFVFFCTIIEKYARELFIYMANQKELSIFFNYIDTRASDQGKAFETAARDNWKAQQNGTEEQKQLAEEILWIRFRAFAVLSE